MSALWNQNISMIHCFGDSLTEGYGVLPGEGWVALADHALKGITLYNHGLSGSMASDILDRLSAASGRVRKGEGYFSWVVPMISSLAFALWFWKIW